MKPAHPIVKILTLTVFVVLISGFVAYRTGKLNGMMYGERISVDSPAKDSIVEVKVMMSSSKSGILYEEAPAYGKVDTPPKPKPENKKPPVYMGGSKSAAVFVPEPDTSKEEKPQQQQQQQPKK